MYGRRFWACKFDSQGPTDCRAVLPGKSLNSEVPAVKLGSIGVVAMTALTLGCATLGASLESRGEKRLNDGLEALAREDYGTAYQHLAWVARHYGHEKSGQRALLTLAALEIDPRNPGRRISIGTQLAGEYLRLPETSSWTQPIAKTLYLLGLEMAATDSAAEQRTANQQARLPSLPGPSVSARIRAAEQERDRMARRVETLEKQLAAKEQELERIRKTIRQ